MMIKPGITELSRHVDSRYTLVAMAAKRARMVGIEQNNAEVYDTKADKPVTVAVQEIAKGRVGYVRSEDIKRAKEFEDEKFAAILSMNEAAHEHGEASTADIEVAEENREEAAAMDELEEAYAAEGEAQTESAVEEADE